MLKNKKGWAGYLIPVFLIFFFSYAYYDYSTQPTVSTISSTENTVVATTPIIRGGGGGSAQSFTIVENEQPSQQKIETNKSEELPVDETPKINDTPKINSTNEFFIPLAGQFYCGDSYCTLSINETKANCPLDCNLFNNHCGDGICNYGEGKDSCPPECWKTDSGYSATARDLGTTYHSWQQVVIILKNLTAQHPEHMSYEVIGKTIWGNDIYLFKVGNPNGGKFMFDGRAHGQEDCGTENGIAFISWALTNNSPESKDVLEKNYLLFIAGINIDSNRRQNMRRLYPNGTVVYWGVDLNRNFVYGWGSSGSGDPKAGYDYRGQSAGSEPETQAVRSAMIKYKPQIYLNVHCGGGKQLGGCGNSTLGNKILDNIEALSKVYNTSTMSYYNPHLGGCGGGFVYSDGANIGKGTGWLTETAGWSEMPPTLNGYLAKYWKAEFPVYLGMAQAIQ